MSPGTEFPRNQWYVAAYGSEITGELSARTICGEPLVFCGIRPATWSRSPTGACTGGSRCRSRTGSVTPSSAATTGSPTTAPAPASPCPARSGSRAPPGSGPTRSSSRTRCVWVWIGDPRRRRPMRVPRAPWFAAAGLDDRARPGTAGRAALAAARQPPRPLARDVPARRLHRHARSRGDPDQHRSRRGRGHRPRQPSHGRRRVPAVLRRVHRHHRPDHPLAGHRVPRRPACTCCTAGSPRSASCRPTARPRRPGVPHRGRLRAHTGDADSHARLLDRRARLRAR